MTTQRKNKIIDNIMNLLIQLTNDEPVTQSIADTAAKPVEMLTIKECTEVVHGLSEHTVRQLVAQDKVKYVRTGQGKLIVIDTLQMVRNEKDCGYGADYKELSILKSLADKLAITILLVHHTRKCYDSDPFNMISGSTGISGCVDGSMVLLKSKRGSREAKLYCVGRDIENQEYRVLFHEHRWTPCDEITPTPPDIFSFAIHDFMMEQQSFIGSATNLCDLLYQKFNRKYFPNRLSRDLIQHTEELERYGVLFNFRRSHGCRILELEYIASGDSSDGRILWVEIIESTGTRNSENADSALFECGDSNETGAGNSQKGDGRTASGDGNFEMGDSNITTITVPADGDDFIAMMAEGLRSQLESQGIHVKPFNSTE